MSRTFLRLLSPLARRIRLTAARAVIALVNDATKLQGVQVKLLAGEVRDCARFQQYGFTSVPHVGAEGVFLSLNGSRDQGVVICVDDRRYRLSGLEGGEVALYTDEGDSIVLARGNVIRVNAGVKVEVNTPLATFSGNVAVAGNVSDANGSMQEMRDLYNGHGHPDGTPPSPQMT